MDTLRALRVLGLPPSAGPEEIGNAWRDLAKVWHPDRFAHDERLRRKATANLQRINEAHEALRHYDPAKTPALASRVRESVAIILGMGDLGEAPMPPPPPPPPAPGTPFTPTAPIGRRNSLRILGIGRQRRTGEAGTRHSEPLRLWPIAVGLFLMFVVFALVTLLR